MSDLIYLVVGSAVLGLFGLYALALRRVWPCSWCSSTRREPWLSPLTWSRRCCAPTNS